MKKKFPQLPNSCYFLGPTGPTGPQGIKGETGESETIQIGNVETGEPYDLAKISDRKEDKTHIFDFVIPRGLEGKQGIEGPTGPTAPMT